MIPSTSADPGFDVEALLAGDESAFEALVRQESGRLFRVIQRMVDDADEAENLVQETFLQAFERLASFRRESKFTTWLYAIGINLARASLRKSKRFVPLDEEAVDRLQPTFSGGSYSEPVETWDPQRYAEKTERVRLVRDAIDRLPTDYRTVILLRDIEEVDTDDVASMLGISNGAVRVRLHRARQALRSMLDGHLH